MKHVGMFEAKTNLSALVEEVEKGGAVTITRHGKPVARLVPATSDLTDEEIERRRDALGKLRALANKLKVNASPDVIKTWINEGRH
jgi:prevent-host-death family protein